MMKISMVSPCEWPVVFLFSFSLAHKFNRLIPLNRGHFMPIQYFQLLEIIQHSHFVVGLMRRRIIEEIEMAHGGQRFYIADDGIKVSQLVIIEYKGFYMSKD